MDPWQGQWKHIKAYYYVAIGNRYVLLHLLIGILLAWVASNDTKNYFSPRNGLDNYPHDLTLTQKDWTENPMHSSLILVVHIGTGSIYSYGKNQGDHLH
jgi:hypothetical protein